jgi:hypothetical protein
MLNETKNNIDLKKFPKSLVFEEKENKNSTLKEKMISHSNEVLGIKVISVELPNNYNPDSRTKKKFSSWFKSIKNSVK